MLQYYLNDLEILVRSIYEITSQLHPGTEDDLESLLTWLNPNEIDSNHQLRPPPLRLKNAIKMFINQFLNSGPNNEGDFENISGLQKELLVLLRQYYFFEVRLNFFSRFDRILTFKDIQKLEAYYEFPFKHIFLFQNNIEEWIIERNGIRHYLLNRNTKFREHLEQRLRDLIMEDDFDLAGDILLWLNQAQGALSSNDMLLELILLKISDFCEKNMKNVYGRRFLVMETFNNFISKYWSNFAKFLGCLEDDHGLTTIIYNCFAKQFIKLRIREVFDVFIVRYPKSKPTILEMKKAITNTDDFKRLVMHFLSSFEKRILNPSVTTVDALLAYVKCIKAFLLLDPSGKYLTSVTSFVKSHFQERQDLVVVLLYAILDFQSEEIFEETRLSIDVERMKILASELRDPDFSIETSSNTYRDAKELNEQYIASSSNTEADEGPQLLYQGVIKEFLTWTPQPTDSIPKPFNQSHRSLLDILMTMFESKDFFISEFLKLLRKKLLTLKYYKLNRNWSKCLRLMKQKLKDKDNRLPANEPTATDDSSNSNKMGVMLKDIKSSELLCKRMHQVAGLDSKIFPKFISFLYWNRKFDYKNDVNVDFKLTEKMFRELEKYCNVYKELQAGRTLQLCKDEGIVELELAFKDGAKLECTATLEQCTAIELFNSGDTASSSSARLTISDISAEMKISEHRASKILGFWVDKGVLRQSGDLFCTVDDIEQDQNTSQPSTYYTATTQHSPLSQDYQCINNTQELPSKIWPFIQGMLTNLGSLKLEKIHAFLKVTLPKDFGYDAVTQSGLESYLGAFVEDGKLLVTSNNSYKLAK